MLIVSMFVILLILILMNVPIAVALAVAGVMGLLATEGVDSLVTVALDMYDGSTKFSLIAIPMFVLAGAIMNATGITVRLINFVSALIGFVRGGLAMVNVGVSLFFAEISGSAVADVAAMGFRSCNHLFISITRHHYPAINSNDPLRCIGGDIGRTTVCGWNCTGSARRGWLNGRRLHVCGSL